MCANRCSLRLCSWNVAGWKSTVQRISEEYPGGIIKLLDHLKLDILCIQEHKISSKEIGDLQECHISGWSSHWAVCRQTLALDEGLFSTPPRPITRSGYAGVAVYSRSDSLRVLSAVEHPFTYEILHRALLWLQMHDVVHGTAAALEQLAIRSTNVFNNDGRVLIVYYKTGLVIVTIYAPAARPDRRLYKILFHAALLEIMRDIRSKFLNSSVLLVGDFNLRFTETHLHPTRRSLADDLWLENSEHGRLLRSLTRFIGSQGSVKQFPIRTKDRGSPIYSVSNFVSYRIEVPRTKVPSGANLSEQEFYSIMIKNRDLGDKIVLGEASFDPSEWELELARLENLSQSEIKKQRHEIKIEGNEINLINWEHFDLNAGFMKTATTRILSQGGFGLRRRVTDAANIGHGTKLIVQPWVLQWRGALNELDIVDLMGTLNKGFFYTCWNAQTNGRGRNEGSRIDHIYGNIVPMKRNDQPVDPSVETIRWPLATIAATGIPSLTAAAIAMLPDELVFRNGLIYMPPGWSDHIPLALEFKAPTEAHQGAVPVSDAVIQNPQVNLTSFMKPREVAPQCVKKTRVCKQPSKRSSGSTTTLKRWMRDLR